MNFKHGPIARFAFVGLALVFAAHLISAHAHGLAFDTAGNLFQTDSHSIFKFTPDGTKSTFASGFKNSLSLAFDSKGNLFVGDADPRAIYKFTPDGKKSTFATGVSSFGMAIDRSDNVYVSGSDSIFKFTPEGVKSTFASGLGNPIDLAFDKTGNLFVADMAVFDARLGRSIFKFSPDGTKSTFTSGLEHPIDIAVDGAGNLFVTEVTAPDASSHSILKFSPDGTRSTFTSEVGRTSTLGMAVDRSGNVFVANQDSILKFDSNGTPSTLASDLVSPDKQWEYECVDGNWPEIHKTSTAKRVLDLMGDDRSVPHAHSAEVVWAPDSKRFAFNYGPPTAAHSTYETTAFYQLRGEEWVLSHSPINEESSEESFAELAKHLPKGVRPPHLWRFDANRVVFKVRNWTDADTAILYVYSAGTSNGASDSPTAFLFTLKFDAEEKSKIVNARQMPKKDIED